VALFRAWFKITGFRVTVRGSARSVIGSTLAWIREPDFPALGYQFRVKRS
jgi:hypothetical protein